tara:strand:- start:290 stop:787 length:498 start_codon:yes stop_codon:yes gene_type:complete
MQDSGVMVVFRGGIMKRINIFPLWAASLFIVTFTSAYSFNAEPVVIKLTQTPCTIIEAEKNPQTFNVKNSDDCKRINKKTSKKRPLKTLHLKPGKTIFRVENKNVPYELAFWVRGTGVKRLTLPSASGGGLKTGKTQDYIIDLKPGEYLFNCPLNPTPDYPLVVE